MKKILALLIGFNVLFIANQAFAAFICTNIDGCFLFDVIKYRSTDDSGYKQCLLQQQQNQQNIIDKENEKQAKIYEEEQNAKKEILNERVTEMSQYSDFFQKVGVNLTLDTSNVQYENWLEQLKEAKNDYIKEQENQQKIIELEERISNLESKPTVVEQVVTPTNGINTHNKGEVIKPIVNDNKIIKPTLKKEEIKKDVIEEKPSPVIETITPTETPIIPTNKSFFQRVFNWFKSLL